MPKFLKSFANYLPSDILEKKLTKDRTKAFEIHLIAGFLFEKKELQKYSKEIITILKTQFFSDKTKNKVLVYCPLFEKTISQDYFDKEIFLLIMN